MNIDGVDASVSGITECPVPPSWAEIALPGEVRAEPGVDDGVTVGEFLDAKSDEDQEKPLVKLW